jgi:phenylpyruvate tautomerase PptA (4-oxalocrotonate tautomerase family)
VPLVRIATNRDPILKFGRRTGDLVHQALTEALGIPEGDHFQVIADAPGTVVYDPDYLGVQRTDDIVLIQITLARGRTTDQKKALYARIAELLHSGLGVRPDDVLINLIEVGPQDWSFGNGKAQFADDLPAHLRGLHS